MPELLHRAMERTAARRPENPAFRCREKTLTYAGLLDESRRMAGLLRSTGVRPGDRVGILSGKSIELPVSVYGVLGAGAAYVPLDITLPAARLDALIADCGIRVLISEPNRLRTLSRLAADLDAIIGIPEASALRYRCIGRESVQAEPARDFNDVGEDDLAYVIYTSGSTDSPKGIMHTHASALAFARAAAATYGLVESDRLSNFPPLQFDQSVFDFFSGVLAGAATVLITEDVMRFSADLAALIERERLTVWYSVPLPLKRMMADGALEDRDLSRVRWILYGGEAFHPDYVRKLFRFFPNATISNVYGPAETNQCTFFNVSSPEEVPDEGLPIGPTWRWARSRVVDPDDVTPKPVREGELLISSPTTMIGYWGGRHPDAFVEIEESDGARRYYRTGDIVRDDAGSLVFLGRRDRMVKLRGQRVELDEVESVLNGLESVSEAAVYTVIGEDGEAQVRAAVIPSQRPPDAAALTRALQSVLPPAAVPVRIDVMQRFPRTASGKINRRELAERGSEATAV